MESLDLQFFLPSTGTVPCEKLSPPSQSLNNRANLLSWTINKAKYTCFLFTVNQANYLGVRPSSQNRWRCTTHLQVRILTWQPLQTIQTKCYQIRSGWYPWCERGRIQIRMLWQIPCHLWIRRKKARILLILISISLNIMNIKNHSSLLPSIQQLYQQHDNSN